MPKFKTYRGLPAARMLTQVGEELHIGDRVYRVSDLSEIVGRQGLPRVEFAYPGNQSTPWTIRAKRGFNSFSRAGLTGSSIYYGMSDHDIMLCGVWKDATIAGFNVDDNVFRSVVVGSYAGGLQLEYNKLTAAIANIYTANTILTSNGGYGDGFVALTPRTNGRLLMNAYGAPSNCVASVEALLKSTPITGAASTVLGSRTASVTLQVPRRVYENELRSFFISTNNSGTQSPTFKVDRVQHDTFAATTISGSVAAPAGAAAPGSGSGYANSAPSYAIETDVNELSSYIAWRTTSTIEIHRLQLNAIDGNTTGTNSLVSLDTNPMAPHGVSTHNTGIRCVVATLPNGEKYLLVMAIDNQGTPTPATSKLYCYRIVSKNVLQFVSTVNLATSPRSYLASDDNWTRFVVAYDDRYEMWTVGVGGAMSLSDTVLVSRYNTNHFFQGDPHGFDSVGRFWYIVPETINPAVVSELALNFIAPPGAVNTIKIVLDKDGYDFTGAAVPGVMSVSVLDINGNHIAASVKLSGSSNVTFGSSTITTTTAGPTNVPFSVTAPGEIVISGETV